MSEWQGIEVEIGAVYRQAMETGLTGPSDKMLDDLLRRAVAHGIRLANDKESRWVTRDGHWRLIPSSDFADAVERGETNV